MSADRQAVLRKFALKPPLTTNVVILNGIARSGKKLSCRIISHLERVEYFQYTSIVENLCYLYGLGMIERENAAALLRAHVDEAIYNYMVGRCLNTRASDDSSIYNAPDLELYLRRSVGPAGRAAADEFNAANRVALLDTHNTLAWAGLLFAAMPYLKFVHVTRHPVDLAEDWFRRGWGRRYGVDPVAFSLVFPGPDGSLVPWFAAEWANEYSRFNEHERCVESVIRLQAEEDAAYRALPAECKRRVFRYPLEHLLAEPDIVVRKLCRFIGVQPRDSLAALLVEERCPTDVPVTVRASNFRLLAENSSSRTVERLREAADAYEAAWGVSPLSA